MREDILATKLEKLAKSKAAFGTAYPDTVARTHTSAEVLDQFDALNGTDTQVSVVGRVKSLRVMGKIAFCHIEDGTEKMQGFCSVASAWCPPWHLQLIYHLVKERGFTLEGAKTHLKEGQKKTLDKFDIINKLETIKAQLLSIKSEL